MTDFLKTAVAYKEELLKQEQIAAELGKSIAWCERARWNNSGPAFIKIGRSVRYRRADLNAWLESQRRTWSRSEAA